MPKPLKLFHASSEGSAGLPQSNRISQEISLREVLKPGPVGRAQRQQTSPSFLFPAPCTLGRLLLNREVPFLALGDAQGALIGDFLQARDPFYYSLLHRLSPTRFKNPSAISEGSVAIPGGTMRVNTRLEVHPPLFTHSRESKGLPLPSVQRNRSPAGWNKRLAVFAPWQAPISGHQDAGGEGGLPGGQG